MQRLDLDDLPRLDAALKLFGVDRPRAVAFRSLDHISDACIADPTDDGEGPAC
jgi:DUF1365 family protein